VDEQAAGRLAANINRNYFSIERSPGRVARYRAMAVVSRPAPDGDRDFGVRVSDEREDEFTLWDDADVQEAKALARAHRANRFDRLRRGSYVLFLDVGNRVTRTW
jgi:hypothetical protein